MRNAASPDRWPSAGRSGKAGTLGDLDLVVDQDVGRSSALGVVEDLGVLLDGDGDLEGESFSEVPTASKPWLAQTTALTSVPMISADRSPNEAFVENSNGMTGTGPLA